jgi:hypothetical protein
MLSFFAPPEKSALETIDPNLKQMVITKKGTSDTWINLDFTLNIRPHNYFSANEAESLKKIVLLNVYGANQTDLNFGTDFNTLSAKSSLGASGGGVSGFATFLNNGYEYISSGTSLLESIEKLDGKINPPPSSQAASNIQSDAQVAPLAIGTVAAAVGVVKNLFGFVKSFFGGSKSASNTQTTLQYSGIVNTTGTATLTNNLYSIEFNPNYNGSLSPAHYVPLYKQPFGLFHLPTVNTLFIEQKMYELCNSAKFYYYGGTLHLVSFKTEPTILHETNRIFNENSSMILDTVKAILFNNQAIDPSAPTSFGFINSTLEKLNNNLTSKSPRLEWVEDWPRTSAPTTDYRVLGTLFTDRNTAPYQAGTSSNLYPKYIGIEIKYHMRCPCLLLLIFMLGHDRNTV